ncbi:MGH1-like glycoside hydrolase domain-containing protein [Bifidobacterium avesanii]|uniref:Mannosylglycerate hydrolase MGH1-like glycoside hydrolase domain-containing protein n=1 Tax=Bifidobacterium avesanii TaxID=1798157 RepID=A0A7K3THN5_9BIFI|nr:trehalase family glycosidase [Bifidobacterium avesanii]KAB8292030.1 neutral trehalase [Bifidobacterium avesanii]NEG78607.1 hypothetical protein [Bifidobacterium avesanii]
MPQSRVTFSTDDELEQRLFDAAEAKSLGNIKDFAGRPVLVEGGGYEKIWLETQPMGGEMYAKRDLEVGLNNQLFFIETQREDGRLAGAIACEGGVVDPQFNQFQGFCFAEPALNMYYLTGRNPDYLHALYRALKRFDAYLWATRDSDGDGCLETWCQFDTGEDHALRFADAPTQWRPDTPPTGFEVVPIASMDFMGYSYASRDVLARICALAGQQEESASWRAKADQVLNRMREYLWDDGRGAYFDRDRHHRVMPVLLHNTLRTMYWGAITPAMANRFVDEHLTNPREFWPAMPLPSVAVNDPLFRNVPTNNWSGASEALTYQRAIRALERYGRYELIPKLGRALMEAIGPDGAFVQQFDPFTGRPYESAFPGQRQDAYGPCMLSVLEYLSRMHGVHIEFDRVIWGSCGKASTDYTQEWDGRTFRIVSDGRWAEAFIDGVRAFSVPAGRRVVTDLTGEMLAQCDF